MAEIIPHGVKVEWRHRQQGELPFTDPYPSLGSSRVPRQPHRGSIMPSYALARTISADPAQMLLSLAAGIREYALLVLDANGCILSWNDGARQLHGYEVHEAIGRHFSCLYPPEDVAAGEPERHLDAARNGQRESVGDHMRKDNSRFLAHTVTTMINAADNAVLGFGLVIRDITASTAAAREAEVTETRLRSLIATVLDTVVDGLITIDRHGVVQSYNKACTTLFGYTPEEIVGQNVRVLMPEPYHSEHD